MTASPAAIAKAERFILDWGMYAGVERTEAAERLNPEFIQAIADLLDAHGREVREAAVAAAADTCTHAAVEWAEADRKTGSRSDWWQSAAHNLANRIRALKSSPSSVADQVTSSGAPRGKDGRLGPNRDDLSPIAPADGEDRGPSLRKHPDGNEYPWGKLHCGGDACDSDPYSEYRCNCWCSDRCGDWNDWVIEGFAASQAASEGGGVSGQPTRIRRGESAIVGPSEPAATPPDGSPPSPSLAASVVVSWPSKCACGSVINPDGSCPIACHVCPNLRRSP